MRRFAFLLVAVGLVGWSVTTLIGGCGADDEAPDTGDAAPDADPFAPGKSGTSGSPGTSGVPGSGGTSGTGSPGPEGGTPQGPTPNPGKLSCGATECDAGNEAICCIRDGGSDTSCRRFGCGGGGAGSALEVTCDETTDCPKRGGGQRQTLCCYFDDTNATLCIDDTECPARGPDPGPRICKTDAECGDAGLCNPKSCGDRGNLLYVCGSPTGCK